MSGPYDHPEVPMPTAPPVERRAASEAYDPLDAWQHDVHDARSPLRGTIGQLTRYGNAVSESDVAVRLSALQLQVLIKLSDQLDRFERALDAWTTAMQGGDEP